MSSVSSIGSAHFSATASVSQVRQNPNRIESDGDAGGRPHRGGGGHRIGGAIGEALQQIGLNLPPPPPGANPAGGVPQAGPPQAPGTSDVGKAFHEFAHTLFQALRSQDREPGQDRLEHNVQSLLQQVAGDTESDSGTVSDLTDAFNTLVEALGGGAASEDSETAPTLQAFLEKFLQDLQGGGNADSSGLSVNISV